MYSIICLSPVATLVAHTYTHSHFKYPMSQAPDLPQSGVRWEFWGGVGKPQQNRELLLQLRTPRNEWSQIANCQWHINLTYLCTTRYLLLLLPQTPTGSENTERAKNKKKSKQTKRLKILFKLLLSSFEIRRSCSASTTWQRFALSL